MNLEDGLSAERIREIADQMAATDGQVAQAMRIAATFAAKLAQRYGGPKLTDATDVSSETLRRRLKIATAQGRRANGEIRFSSAKSAQELRVRARAWFGFNALRPEKDLHPAANLRQDEVGVKAGRYRWDGAWIGRVGKGKSEGVWARAGKARLPIVRQFASIDSQAYATLTSAIFPHVSKAFYEKFESELAKIIEREDG